MNERACQAPLSMEFSRQEYWGGLPFLSPGDFPKVKVKLLSHIWLFVTPWTIAYQSGNPHGILQARILEWVAISFSRGSSRPRDQTRVSCVSCTGRQDSFTTEPPGKPVCHNIHKYILHLCKYMPDSLTVPISLIKLYNHLGTSVPFWSLLYVGLAINLFLKMWVTDDRKDG